MAATSSARRRPRLRVVGGEKRPPRHATLFNLRFDDEHGTFGYVFEVLSWAEFDALPLRERPAGGTSHLPGIGVAVLRPAADCSAVELQEIRDAVADERDRRALMTGAE